MITTTTAELIGVLNDLIKINNDRITGYNNAAQETNSIDADLRATFEKMANQSRENVNELTEQLDHLGAEVETGTTTMGKLYRAWMDIKATFTGHDRKSILAACEYGEDAAQRAYREAMASDADMDTETRHLIAAQQDSLKKSHDLIKKYRDSN